MKFLKHRHEVYDRGDILDCFSENSAMERIIFPYMEENELYSLSHFRMLVDKGDIGSIIAMLDPVAKVVSCWDTRILLLGRQRKFILEIGLKGSINCTQLQAVFWTKCGEEKVVSNEVSKTLETIKAKVDDAVIMDVDWFSSVKDEGIGHMTIKEVVYETVHLEAYPYVDLKSFIDGYFKSSSSVLLISGAPGTGKTKLIRHIIRCAAKDNPEFMTKFRFKHCYPDDEGPSYISEVKRDVRDANAKVAYTTDLTVLGNDSFYTQLRTLNYQFVVLEDIDFKLSPRKEGNDLMHKFLAISDGFVSTNCKIILSTNLNIAEIDPALIRPGRCYSSIETRKLTFEEANKFLDRIRKKLDLDARNEYSLAELYGMAYNLTYKVPPIEKKVGFHS